MTSDGVLNDSGARLDLRKGTKVRLTTKNDSIFIDTVTKYDPASDRTHTNLHNYHGNNVLGAFGAKIQGMRLSNLLFLLSLCVGCFTHAAV